MLLTEGPPKASRRRTSRVDVALKALRESPGAWACVRTTRNRGTAGSYAHWLRQRWPELQVTVRDRQVWASVKVA